MILERKVTAGVWAVSFAAFFILVLGTNVDASAAGAAASAVSPAPQAPPAPAEMTDQERISYTLGVQSGKLVSRVFQQTKVDLDAYLRGIKDVVQGKRLVLTEKQMTKSMEMLQRTILETAQKEHQKQAEENAAEAKAFLAKNAKEKGVITLPDGLQYKVLAEGSGASPLDTDRVKMNYRGTYLDGKEFDSSFGRNKPSEFHVNKLSIKGWSEIIPLMKVGGKCIAWIPPALAYGERGRPGIAPDPGIGPNKLLVIEMELLDITSPAAPGAAPAPKS